MPNHQLAPAKYHFCDYFNERLMFRSNNKNCGQKSTVLGQLQMLLLMAICVRKYIRETCPEAMGKILIAMTNHHGLVGIEEDHSSYVVQVVNGLENHA